MKEKEALYVTIGLLIRRARKKAGVTQEALAYESGISRTSLVNTEAGKQRLQVITVYKIAQALGIDARDLLPQSSKVLLDSGEALITRAVEFYLAQGCK